MTDKWPENPDEQVDPAFAPLIEAGEGESEGFDVAEADLIRHAEHSDQHGTDPITRDAAGFDEPEDAALEDDGDVYGAADAAEGDTEEQPDETRRRTIARAIATPSRGRGAAEADVNR